MFSKAFKLTGLIGGGILALGTGAVGSHLAQPHLKSVFNPDRKNKEDQLQESLKDAEDKVEVLTRNLSELINTGELQKTSISGLEGQVQELNGEVDKKTKELENKDSQLSSKNQELQTQKDLNGQQLTQITNLQQQLDQKKKDLSDETDKKNQIQQELNVINQRLSLTRENILTEKAIKESSLRINTRHVKWKSSGSGIATFDVVDFENKSKTITIKNNGITNHETKAREIRSQGITFKLHSDFEKWEKIVHVQRHDVDYFFTATKEDQKSAFIKPGQTSEQNIKFEDYFKPKYYEEAFKVLVAISFLDIFPMCHNLEESSPDKPYVFCSDKNINQEFLGNGTQKWNEFTAAEEKDKKFQSHLYSFVTINDFISYWTKKTVDFVRTGTVDLFDFLNPIVISKNYTSN